MENLHWLDETKDISPEVYEKFERLLNFKEETMKVTPARLIADQKKLLFDTFIEAMHKYEISTGSVVSEFRFERKTITKCGFHVTWVPVEGGILSTEHEEKDDKLAERTVREGINNGEAELPEPDPELDDIRG